MEPRFHSRVADPGASSDKVQRKVFERVDSGDEASLDHAIHRLADADLRTRIRTAARAEAEKYSWENASDDLLRYYEMAIGMHAPRY